MDVAIDEDVDLDIDIHSQDFYKNLSQKSKDKTEEYWNAKYLYHLINAHMVNSLCRRLLCSSVSHGDLWNKECHYEELVLFITVCSFIYI